MSGIHKSHGVTGVMAYLDMLMPELEQSHHEQALDAINRTHAQILGDYKPAAVPASINFPDLSELRQNPLDWASTGEQLQHVVKLCDASLRAFSRSTVPSRHYIDRQRS